MNRNGDINQYLGMRKGKNSAVDILEAYNSGFVEETVDLKPYF